MKNEETQDASEIQKNQVDKEDQKGNIEIFSKPSENNEISKEENINQVKLEVIDVPEMIK